MKFSIVIPTYNEEKDIAATLDSLVNIDWPDFEIIVVDDSSDGTPGVVATFADRGVRLIRPEFRAGRCAARNRGILAASGDVVVILNADAHLPADFLRLISGHYSQGADYVLVRAEVSNLDDLFARYVESVSRVKYYGHDSNWLEWTEGFSCRRQLAVDAGLFPTGYVVPLCAGEDGVFGSNLRSLGAKKVIDLGIVCTHVAPSTLSDYWRARKEKGQGSPQVKRFLQGWSFGRIAVWAFLRAVRTAILMMSIVPIVWICVRYCRKSARGWSDFFPFCFAWMIDQAAFSVGEWQSLIEIQRAEARTRSVALSAA